MLAISITAPMALAKKDENNGKQLGKTKEKKVKTQEGEQVAETEEFGKTYTPAADNGLNKGKSPVEHLYLYEKDPTTWEIVPDGAWAKITILTHKDKFIFNGHGLEEFVDYSLINYAATMDWETYEYDPDVSPDDPWLMNDYDIGSATADEEGNVHIKGTWDIEELPDYDIEGKIWLVLDNDHDSEINDLTAWTPESYLFEYDLLRAKEIL